MAKQESEYSKLVSFLKSYEKILHPDVFNPMLSQLHKAFEENKREAYENAKISQEALQIEQIMIEAKRNIERVLSANNDDKHILSLFYKGAYKKIVKIFQGEEK